MMTIRPIYQVSAEVTALRELGPGYYFLTLKAPEIAAAAEPGQFAQLRPARVGTLDPLLARPISIHRIFPQTGEVAFIFKVVGRGTTLLATFEPGETLTVLGPVGTGFTVSETATRVALVGGGVGMPPLFCLAEALRRTRPEVTVELFYGGRTRDDLLLLPEWEALGVTVHLATDDGSRGHHGMVTGPLRERLSSFEFLAACGPRPMLVAVQQLALAAGVPGQLSLEAHMACGVGACLGCICATVSGNRRVCVDGPVFALEEVTFDA